MFSPSAHFIHGFTPELLQSQQAPQRRKKFSYCSDWGFQILILLRHSISSNSIIKDASLKKSDNENVRSKDWRAYMTTMAVVGIFCCIYVLADWTYIWTILLTTLLFFTVASKRSHSRSRSHSPSFEQGVHSLKSLLSSYRVSVMIVTCLCILAIDFRIFPRKYAKTETYGTSLNYSKRTSDKNV